MVKKKSVKKTHPFHATVADCRPLLNFQPYERARPIAVSSVLIHAKRSGN